MYLSDYSRMRLEPKERLKYFSVSRSSLPTFLSKRAPHSPFAALLLVLPKSRLGCYLQKVL